MRTSWCAAGGQQTLWPNRITAYSATLTRKTRGLFTQHADSVALPAHNSTAPSDSLT
jgi:hypothetical protein